MLNGNMSQEEVYKNILNDYKKEAMNKINEDNEENEISYDNWFIDFLKYFFFIK